MGEDERERPPPACRCGRPGPDPCPECERRAALDYLFAELGRRPEEAAGPR